MLHHHNRGTRWGLLHHHDRATRRGLLHHYRPRAWTRRAVRRRPRRVATSHGSLVFAKLALVFAKLTSRTPHFLFGQLNKALHCAARIQQHRLAGAPLVRRGHCAL